MRIEDITDKQPVKKYLLDMAAGNDDLYYDFYFNDLFLTERYDGPNKHLNDIVRSQWKRFYEWSCGEKPERDVLNRANRALVKDSLTGMVILDRWGQFKKVYQFDAELEFALTDVDEVKIPINMLDKLPYKSFYIEFAKDGIFSKNFHGTFVYVIKHGNGYLVSLERVTENLETMCGKAEFLPEGDASDATFIVDKNSFVRSFDHPMYADWSEFTFFVLNAMLYLCSSNAEIRTSARTKHTHKSGKQTGKWHDLEILECGYAYGAKVRQYRKQIISEAGESQGKNTIFKRTVRPHPVRASWQHYWIGSGKNKERVLRFKAEYFVGGASRFATISKVE